MPVVLLVVIAQLMFTVTDLLARANLRSVGMLSLAAIAAPWFVVYVLLKLVATGIQLSVLAIQPIGTAMALFSASSLVLVNVAGVLLLGEILSTQAYIAIALALCAIGFIATAR